MSSPVKYRAFDGTRMRGVFKIIFLEDESFSVHFTHTQEGEPGWLNSKDDRLKLMQFTGLYDSTKWVDLTDEERDKWVIKGNLPSKWVGREICEGDIVTETVYFGQYKPEIQGRESRDHKSICEWGIYSWVFVCQSTTGPKTKGNSYRKYDTSFTVIGNIHDQNG